MLGIPQVQGLCWDKKGRTEQKKEGSEPRGVEKLGLPSDSGDVQPRSLCFDASRDPPPHPGDVNE